MMRVRGRKLAGKGRWPVTNRPAALAELRPLARAGANGRSWPVSDHGDLPLRTAGTDPFLSFDTARCQWQVSRSSGQTLT